MEENLGNILIIKLMDKKSSGSLGHILGYSLGISYNRFINKNKNKIYVILGDGELSGDQIGSLFYFLKSIVI